MKHSLLLFFPAVNDQAQKDVQEDVNNFQMNLQWVASVPSIFFGIIAGALSDEFGRKPLLLFPLIGELIRSILNIFHYAFIETLPLEFFYFEKIGSFFGGSTVYYLGVYSFGTSVTKPNERAFRLARLDGIETFATIVGTLLSPIIFRHLGYFGIYSVSCGFLIPAIIYLIFIVKEPMEVKVEESSGHEQNKKCHLSLFNVINQNLTKVKSFFTVAVVMPLLAIKSVITKDRKTILKFFIICQFFCYGLYLFTLEIQGLVYLYMLLVFDGFNETDYAMMNIVMLLLAFVCLIIVMPILSGKLKIHDAFMLFIIVSCEVVSSTTIPFVKSLWQFYFTLGLGTIGVCKYAVVRSLMSKCIDSNEVGKVFSLFAVAASIAPIGGNPIFRQLYNKTMDTFPGAIFLLCAGLLFLAACVNLFSYFMRLKIIHHHEETPNEQESDGKINENNQSNL